MSRLGKALALGAWLTGGTAAAQVRPEVLKAFAHEPSVSSLQRAAGRLAEVQPERVRSWLRRANKAALLPQLRLKVGHGAYGVALSHTSDGLGYLPSGDSWRVEGEVTWSLDRLVFDRNELGLSRESQRLASRRELLYTEVARLYFARRRLQVEGLSVPAGEPEAPEAVDRALAIDELTAVLDGLTDGAMSRGK
jgi:hypothetical protein